MSRTTVRGLRPASVARIAAAAATMIVAAGLAGCGSADSASPNPSESPSASAPAEVLGIRDPWVKAADAGMTAAFGTLENNGDADVTITAVATDASPMQLHEMAMQDGKMVMQEKKGGIVVKAHGTAMLEPGGDHLMLMDLRHPVKAGDELSFTLTFADGRTQTFTAVAKPFTGAQETYAPDGDESPMPGMSMSPMG